jgi:hypothetical protein
MWLLHDIGPMLTLVSEILIQSTLMKFSISRPCMHDIDCLKPEGRKCQIANFTGEGFI